MNFYEFFSIDAFRKNRDNEASCNLLPLWVMVMTSVSLLLMTINSSINFFIYCLVSFLVWLTTFVLSMLMLMVLLYMLLLFVVVIVMVIVVVVVV